MELSLRSRTGQFLCYQRVFFNTMEYQRQECMEQNFHENYNTGDRDTISHPKDRLEAIRASSMVIGETDTRQKHSSLEVSPETK
jgi:hypothetical protein